MSRSGLDSLALREALTDLRLRTPRLELRLGSERELRELGELFRDGTYPDEMESVTNAVFFDGVKQPDWVENFVAHHNSWLDQSSPAAWRFNFLVFVDGNVIASQGLQSRSAGCIFTNSLMGRRYQGRGYGTEMRAGVLSLAFEVLGARCAISDAWVGNAPSLAISWKLGYLRVGTEIHHPRGDPVEHEVMRLEASRFRPPVAVEIDSAEAFARWVKAPDEWADPS